MTIQQVQLEEQKVLIEAWTREDPEKGGHQERIGNLMEGDVVLLEAKDSCGDRRVHGARMAGWILLKETGEPGRSKLPAWDGPS